MKTLIRFLNIIMVGFVAGSIAGIWLGYNPVSFSYSTYVEYQQNAIASLNTIMPILGLITIILTLFSAFVQKKNKPVFVTLLTATVFLITAGLITRFGNQPINAVVMKWNNVNIPDNWSELRSQWWQYHTGRTLASFIAFCLITSVSIRRE